MSLSRMPNGRWRAQVYDPSTRRSVSVAKILDLDVASFRTKAEAKSAREMARAKLRARHANPDEMTVQAWWELWTSHEMFQRPKAASNINNREMTRGFVSQHGHVLLRDVDRRIVGQWQLAGGKQSAIKFLRTMFSDAVGQELISVNPFSKVGVARSKGNAQKKPPSVEQAWELIDTAWETCPPGFAAWLQVACFSGMRTCELDALEWGKVDFEQGWMLVDREFCSKSMSFDVPKNGRSRVVPLHAPAREALDGLARESEYCFVNSRRHHWVRNTRAYYWNRVRRLTGWDGSLYLSSRHFYGWFAYNELRLPAEDVAAALGHTDRGELVRRLYGHFDDEQALERVKASFAAVPPRDELAKRRRAA
jgi:integrase